MGKQHTLKDLELPDDEPMVVIRSSFLWICDGDKYAAAALNMYVHWTKWIMKHKPVAQEINRELKRQGHKPNQDTSLILYRKQRDLVKDLLGFCNEKRLREANAFLEAKGLLKIANASRSNLDHVLKYELQIDVFKKCMKEWRKYRDGDESEAEEDTDEKASEVALSEADKNPSRSGQKSVSKRTKIRLEADKNPSRSGQLPDSNNRYNKRDDSQIDDQKREGSASKPHFSQKQGNSSLSSQPSTQKSFSFDEVPLEAKSIFAMHDELEGYAVPRTERDIKDALELARCGVTLEDLRAVKDFILEDNAEWYEKHGIDLHALVVYYPKWKSAQMMKTIIAGRPPAASLTQSPTAKAGTARSSYDDDDYVDDTFYKQRPVAKREEVTHATR